MSSVSTTLSGEYGVKGEYHKTLDKKWKYLPVYIEKMVRVRAYLQDKAHLKILDVGCGEGVLVEEFRQKNYNILGVDQNFESDAVNRGSILDLPFADESMDVVLCLDVIEHLHPGDQEQAIAELKRVLKPGGEALITLPNLAHFASRISFLLRGQPIRTSEIERHPGDRTFAEHRRMVKKYLTIEKTKGIFPTFPLLCLITLWSPAKSVWLHRLYNRLLPIKPWCFLNFFYCRK